jgi:hypothetical protein
MDYFVYLQILVSVILFGMVIKRYRDSRRQPPAQAQAPAASTDSEPLGEEPAKDPGRNWRQTPPPPPPKKPWWRLYGGALFIFLGGLAQTSHHAWFVHSNPPPVFEELQAQRVEVLGWQRTHPQLHVRLPNGTSRMVEFPTLHKAGRGGGDLYHVLSFDEQRQLVGQTCQMWGRPLRFSIQDSYQVFSLECEKGGRLRFDEAVKRYEGHYKSGLSATFSIFIPGWILFVFITFWALSVRNRKERLALQTPSSLTASSKAQP